MQTFVVEVLNEKALPLLRDLENLDIIRLTPQEPQPKEGLETSATTGLLSEQFWGCISPETAAELHGSSTKCATNGSKLFNRLEYAD